MALGKPLLATWYADGTLRLYELISGVFVQQAAAGPYLHTPSSHRDGIVFPPGLDFVRDSAFLAIRHAATANSSKLKVLNRDLSVQADTECSSGATNGAAGPTAWDEAHNTHHAIHLYGTGRERLLILSSGATTAGDGDFWVPGGDKENIRGMWISPDGKYMLQGGKNSTSNFMRRFFGGLDSNGATFVENVQMTETPWAIELALWTPDSKYVIAGSKNEGFSVYQKAATGENWEKIYDLPKKPGVAKAIAGSRNGRYVAISYDVGGTITTYIYQRSGPYLIDNQTLASGFGAALAFTADSNYIVDAISKVAYVRGASGYELATGAMANVVSGAVVQSLSTHVEDPVGFSRIYDNRLGDVMEGLVDYSKLKVTLADNNAPAFNPAHTTLAQAVGSAELSSGGWPAGGLPLTNVHEARQGTQAYGIVADPVERIMIVSGASFRYAIVYEVTAGGNKPLIHIDFEKVYAVPKGTKITIQPHADGIIAFSG